MSSVLSRKYGQTEIGNRQVKFNSKVPTRLSWRTQDRNLHHTHRINADVNGALNNMGKVVGDSEIVSRIINSGRLFMPLKFNNLYSLRNIEV